MEKAGSILRVFTSMFTKITIRIGARVDPIQHPLALVKPREPALMSVTIFETNTTNTEKDGKAFYYTMTRFRTSSMASRSKTSKS
ncbi:hypothetical protein BofuT4_uP145600.1 [Botrytis cinerea T4]|uniref:Uncharacterized protein n=1 Tax=Botryotinia fuckeliana (strain T4) TaxID=999810 RepID=G2YXP3_BOTF4|nr:hypothetical protein BofuT4_uP145600.1 [Botrytis cinerea T4]